DRPEDIPLLAASILRSLDVEYRPEDLVPLVDYSWPGNVRELKNFLVRCAVTSRGKLTREIFERALGAQREASVMPEESFLTGTLADIEKQVIVARLKSCDGNRKKAAKELGIAKSTLHEKLRRWNHP